MFQLYAAPQHIVAMLTCIYAFVLQAAKQQQQIGDTKSGCATVYPKHSTMLTPQGGCISCDHCSMYVNNLVVYKDHVRIAYQWRT